MPVTVLRGELVGSDGPTRPRSGLAAEVRAAYLARYSNHNTRAAYTIAIDQWYGWCAEYGADPLTASRGQVEMYARTLELTGRKASTVAGKLHVLSGLFKFAVADELVARNPLVHVRIPKVERCSTSNGVTRTELRDLIRSAEKAGPQDHAVMCLLGYMGLRVSAIGGIDVEHVGREQGAMTVTVRHKGGKIRTLAMSIPTAWAVEQVRGQRSSGPLFINRYGNRFNRDNINRVLQRHVRRVGIVKPLTPHSLRHGFVTIARNLGVSDRDIMASTGHTQIEMLDYYDRDSEQLQRTATHFVTAGVEGVG